MADRCVEAPPVGFERVAWARLDAGWATSEGGWTTPDGSHETNWGEAGYPFPEDVAAYVEWHATFYHYEALDNDLDPAALSAYPDAPVHQQHRYLPRQLPEQPEGQLFTNPPLKMTIPSDYDRCGGAGWEECDDCQRRTSNGEVQMQPPAVVTFWCEYYIPPQD